MIVVAGWLRVDPDRRDAYLQGCRPVVEAARAEAGCVDFSVAPDLIDPGRINVFEQWEAVADVERFRGSGPSDDQQDAILDAHVVQHTVAASEALA